jgi:hypothetical protein
VVGSLFFVLIMIIGIGALVSIFNSFSTYTNTQNNVVSSRIQAQTTTLSVSAASYGAFPPSTTSNFNVASTPPNTCNSQATFPTDRAKLVFVSSVWWEFFTCNSAYQYSTSFDGVTWETPTTIPSLVPGYTVGPDFDVEVSGTTLYLVISNVGAASFQLGIGTLASGGTNSAPAGTITWTSPPAQVATVAGSNAVGPIQAEVDSAGNQWVAIVVGSYAIGIYERQACSSGTSAANGWEPNACSSSGAPGNNAPASFSGLSANAHMIFSPAPSTVSSTGAILLYESGSITNPSTGTLTMVTQAALNTGSAVWQTITLSLSGNTFYSLTSSSAVFIGNTMYFAGLAGSAAGQTSGTLTFWTVAFTYSAPNIVALNTPANTAEVNIETTASTWQAALTTLGTTLALFDNPPAATDSCPAGGICVQYYTSSTLGSSPVGGQGGWSSAILLESAETAINGLSPAGDAFGVTWTGAGANFNVRFASLSSFTVANSSRFGVHVVDLYVYNPATNSLVAHWYYNTTGTGAYDFDYWVGQGGKMVVPIRFVWAASTSYLVTIGTDTGVTIQLTASSLPLATTTCTSGSFLSQISPAQTCSSVPLAASPIVTFTSNANTCTDTTSGTIVMMGLGATYTTSSSSSRNIYVILTFDVRSPGVSTVNTKWQLAYGTGTAPACNAAATGTTTAEQYTIATESTTVLEESQSVGVTLTGLSSSTAYWFDVQALDSSPGAWVYSLPSLSVTDIQTSGLKVPQVGYSSNTNTCTISSTPTLMAGLGTTYTTGSSGFSGNLYLTLSLDVKSPASLAVNSQWRIAYGTGSAPACGVAFTGTTVGNQYQVTTEAAVVLETGQSESVVITGLAPSTAYWFDVQVTDSSVDSWIYSNPTLAVVEVPTAQNLPPNVNFVSNANSCTQSFTGTEMAGFGTTYTTLSSSTGSIFAALTFKVATPATINVNSKWQVVYGTGTPPACNAAATGTTVGGQYTINTEGAVAGGMGQTIGFVLTGLSRGTQYWFDIQATDSSGDVWTYSNPALSVTDIMPADFIHSNTVFSSNANNCGRNTAANAMAGFGASYTTMSFGKGNVQVVLTFNLATPAIRGLNSIWQVAYGTGTAPACNGGATGTTIGNQYTVTTLSNFVAGGLGQSEGFTLVGLSPATTYWFDVQATDSSGDVWTYSNPQISVVELP